MAEVYKIDGKEEMKEMASVVPELTENDFKELPNDHNVLCVDASDFPELADEKKGSDVMFIVRGVIKGSNDDSYAPVAEGEEKTQNLSFYLFDAALVHGKKSMKLGGGGRFEAMESALEKKGYSHESAGAITAAAGRKKYGATKMKNMASTGLRRYWKNK